jgi:hypothetical protein
MHYINFHVFFDYTAGKTCFLSPRTAWWCTNEASTESLWTVDSRNTIFKLVQIRLSATKALKFDRTPGSKQHNINFQVFFDYTAGKTCLLSPRTALSCTNLASTESLWTVDSWNTIFKLAHIPLSATKVLKFDRTSGSKKHNINFHVFFDYTAGKTCFLSPRTA